MAIQRPPVTGDVALDSFNNEVHQQLVHNAGGPQGRDGLPGANGINAATINLYKAVNTDTLADGGSEDISDSAMFGYNYETGQLIAGDRRSLTTDLNGWNIVFPEESDGNYVFQIQVVLADSAEIEPDFPGSLFSAPTLVLDRSPVEVVSVDIVSDIGTTFKSTVTGAGTRQRDMREATLTAEVSINGEVQSDDLHRTYQYTWMHNNNTLCLDTTGGTYDLYLDSSGNPAVVDSMGVCPIVTGNTRGTPALNLTGNDLARTLRVEGDELMFGGTLQLSVEVDNI